MKTTTLSNYSGKLCVNLNTALLFMEDDINSTGNISWKYLIELMHYTEMHFFFIFPFFPQKLMGFQKSIAIFTRRTWIRIRSYVVLKMYLLL